MEVEYGYVMMKMVMSVAIVVVVGSVASVYRALVMKPKRERWLVEKQGIDGPRPMTLLGNLLQMKKAVDLYAAEAKASTIHPPSSITHNCGSSIFPFLDQWTKQYGTVFAFSLGVKTVLHVSQPALLKEITTITSWDLGRPSLVAKELGPLMGQGIIASNGADWATQKKLIAPHLYLDKVKGMMDMIADSSVAIIESIMNKIKIEGGRSIDINNIDDYMRTFSGDVISKVCFGSNYSQSEDIFLKIRRLEELTSNMLVAFGIPGLRYIPTKRNMEAWALEKEVHKLIMKIVNGRKEVAGYDQTETKDMLQMILESGESSGLREDALNKFIVDNCKNMYLAGYGSTAVTSSWCLMLLATNPEWQTRVRTEVLQVCKGAQVPTADMLLQMKQLTMVIYETLRLYPSAPVMGREALNDMKIGDIDVAKGMQIWSYVFTLHTDPEVWGPDSFEFNPQRFANGVVGACKFPHMYMPFGIGPRICLGQHLAMTEIKAVISLFVANLSFSLSPNYVHSPVFKQVVLPKFGISLLLNKL